MTTVTVDFEDAIYERLLEQAEADNTTVSSLIAHLATAKLDRDAEVTEAVEMARAHLTRYPLLFKRLAE